MTDPAEQLQTAVQKLGIGGYRRHVLLCTGPKCCSDAEGMRAWEALKAAIKDLGLSGGEQACYRSKVGCLRVCTQGPIVVVYPEGTWYHGITAERVPRLVQQHLIEGQPIDEWIFARNPLSAEKQSEL